MATFSDERLNLELELLMSMYPDTLHFDWKARDLIFDRDVKSRDRLALRLGPEYPSVGVPEVISARGANGADLRSLMKASVNQVCTEIGGGDSHNPGEVLDVIIAKYLETIESEVVVNDTGDTSHSQSQPEAHKTVIIWLHHLLATSKRKLAIHPSTSTDQVRGVTKPGYPGVMVFSGSRSAVEEHVAELKSQNWQAFAVRYEADEQWVFEKGVQEVETMAEAVKCIQEDKREAFLKAVGVK